MLPTKVIPLLVEVFMMFVWDMITIYCTCQVSPCTTPGPEGYRGNISLHGNNVILMHKLFEFIYVFLKCYEKQKWYWGIRPKWILVLVPGIRLYKVLFLKHFSCMFKINSRINWCLTWPHFSIKFFLFLTFILGSEILEGLDGLPWKWI